MGHTDHGRPYRVIYLDGQVFSFRLMCIYVASPRCLWGFILFEKRVHPQYCGSRASRPLCDVISGSVILSAIRRVTMLPCKLFFCQRHVPSSGTAQVHTRWRRNQHVQVWIWDQQTWKATRSLETLSEESMDDWSYPIPSIPSLEKSVDKGIQTMFVVVTAVLRQFAVISKRLDIPNNSKKKKCASNSAS